MRILKHNQITWLGTTLAFALFIPLFATGGLEHVDFWWWMSFNAVFLTLLSALLDRDWRLDLRRDFQNRLLVKLGLGLASAFILYLVFFIGNHLSRIVSDFASDHIAAIYRYKASVSPIRVVLLITCLIGPAEELFWRAFLQRRLSHQFGKWIGLALATTAYTAMHISSLNPMLILAAAICGIFWGFLYLRLQSVWLNVSSHVAWDLAVFIFFPF